MSTVLVIDAEPATQALLSRALPDGGHEVLVASGRARAREHLRSGLVDVVILDCGEANDHGHGVLDDLRGLQQPPPTIVVAADSDWATRVAHVPSESVSILTKPVNLPDLLARIGPPGPSSRPALLDAEAVDLIVGALRLESRGRTVSLADQHIVLSERECSILTHLMVNAGVVCTRQAIIDDVWGLEPPDSNAVDVGVARLRTRVPGLVIETIRGVGYRLNRRDHLPTSGHLSPDDR